MVRFPSVQEYVDWFKANPSGFISAFILGCLIGVGATVYLLSLKKDWQFYEIENDRAQLRAANQGQTEQLKKANDDLASIGVQLAQAQTDRADREREVAAKLAQLQTEHAEREKELGTNLAQAQKAHEADAAKLAVQQAEMDKLKARPTQPRMFTNQLPPSPAASLPDLSVRALTSIFKQPELTVESLAQAYKVSVGGMQYNLDILTNKGLVSVKPQWNDIAHDYRYVYLTTVQGRAYIVEHGLD